MKFCPYCGTDSPENYKYCGQCQKSLPENEHAAKSIIEQQEPPPSPPPPPPGQGQPKAQQQFQKTSTNQQPQQQRPKKQESGAVMAVITISMVIILLVAIFYVVVMTEPSDTNGGSDPVNGGGDPTGTIITELRAPAHGLNALDFETGQVGSSEAANDMWFDNNNNFHTPDFSRGLITDIGAISGLSAITDIPTLGWVTTCGAVVGHGYVVETIDRSVDPPTTTENFYRVYVDDYIISATTGGVMGFTIKWASLSLGSPPVNEPPTVVVTAPSGMQTGNITISYTLIDETSDTCNVLVEYSIDGGTTWNNAEPGTGGDGTTNLASSPTGISHSYVWDSVADNVATTSVEYDVRIRITPSDTVQGTAGETSDFTVDNFSWETRADMPAGPEVMRYYMTSAVVNGKIYVIGGRNACSVDDYYGEGITYIYNTTEEYDPATDTWRTSQNGELTPMPTPRCEMTSAVVNGKIYVIGGRGGSNVIEEYDPATDTWRTGLTPMPTPRYGMASAVVNGRIYVIGGRSAGDSEHNTTEEYDPATDTWRTSQNGELTPMPTGRVYLISEVIDGKIYAMGGYCGAYVWPVEIYDPATNSWISSEWLQLSTMPSSKYNMNSGVVNGKIYVIGNNGPDIDTVEEYDPATDTWRTGLTPIPNPVDGATSAVVNGKIYVIGGGRTNQEFTPPIS